MWPGRSTCQAAACCRWVFPPPHQRPDPQQPGAGDRVLGQRPALGGQAHQPGPRDHGRPGDRGQGPCGGALPDSLRSDDGLEHAGVAERLQVQGRRRAGARQPPGRPAALAVQLRGRLPDEVPAGVDGLRPRSRPSSACSRRRFSGRRTWPIAHGCLCDGTARPRTACVAVERPARLQARLDDIFPTGEFNWNRRVPPTWWSVNWEHVLTAA